jgi:hypothetical protein
VCSLLCNIFLSFSLTWNVRDLKTNNGRVAINGPSQGSVNGPVDLHSVRHSVRDYQQCTKSSGFYLNVNDSTPVFTSYSTNMCKKHEVSSEILVVMQVY